MSSSVSNSSVSNTPAEAVPGDAPEPVTPTVTHYEQAAAAFAKKLDELLATMPHFVPAHPATKGFVRVAKSVTGHVR